MTCPSALMLRFFDKKLREIVVCLFDVRPFVLFPTLFYLVTIVQVELIVDDFPGSGVGVSCVPMRHRKRAITAKLRRIMLWLFHKQVAIFITIKVPFRTHPVIGELLRSFYRLAFLKISSHIVTDDSK